MPRLIYSTLFVVAACATPLQICLSSATSDLRIVDDLIVVTETNIDRGYALERRTVPRVQLSYCASPVPHFQFCNVPATRTVEEPVAIDLDAERRKLRSLQQQRRVLVESASRDVASCNAGNLQT